MDDLALLREYAARDSEAAFAELVSRRVSFVYSAALRQARDPHLAEEITQAVFILLARKAGQIGDKTLLTGWLFRTTRFAALAQLRAAAKRRQRELEANMQSEIQQSAPDAFWEQMSPLLDEVLERLGEKDRQAVLLRFFENRSLAEVGSRLGISENTAGKRIARALEKLRQGFLKRGVVSTTAIIAGALAAHSVQAAPAALATATTAAAVGPGAAVGASTLTLIQGVLSIMAWTKAKTAIVAGACVLLAAGTATFTLCHESKPMRSVRSEWAVISGDSQHWTFEGGEIKAHSITGSSILASRSQYRDVTFTAVAESFDHYTTLAFRLQDAQNGYFVVFAPANIRINPNGFIRLDKMDSGRQTTLASHQKQKVLEVGHSAKIKVVAKGPSIEVFLNGDRVIQAEDTTFRSGYLGLQVRGSSSSYPGKVAYSHVDFY